MTNQRAEQAQQRVASYPATAEEIREWVTHKYGSLDIAYAYEPEICYLLAQLDQERKGEIYKEEVDKWIKRAGDLQTECSHLEARNARLVSLVRTMEDSDPDLDWYDWRERATKELGEQTTICPHCGHDLWITSSKYGY